MAARAPITGTNAPTRMPEDGEDLEEADPPVGRDAEADVFGPGAHGGYGGQLGRAEGREGDDQEARENRCWCS